jgi:formylglycine-generating enzyme required for sulfatase activity
LTTYYEVLDVPPDATLAQIKTAYRILVQLHHPDRLQQANSQVRHYAEERLKKINEAYAVLSDPARRTRYDASHKDAEADEANEAGSSGKRRRRPAPRTSSGQAAYAEAREWAAQAKQAEREARFEERRRQAQQAAEVERFEAEARAQRAAQEQFPRMRSESNYLVLHFAPGIWTTLLRIPAGEFLMGSDPQCDTEAADNEFPQHRVYVSEFYLGKYPVTNAQFDAFATAAPAKLSARLAGWRLPTGQETHPVVNVTWDEATAFSQWLSAATGCNFRLPTEAEWEKAARGPAGENHNSRIYPWGDDWEATRLAVGIAGQPSGTQPVGHFSPAGDSAYGLCDMSGNVWEWCGDWFDPKLYSSRWRSVVKDPAGPTVGQGNVVRGGAFDSAPKHVRCSRRNWYYPDNARLNLGFRLAADPINT